MGCLHPERSHEADGDATRARGRAGGALDTQDLESELQHTALTRAACSNFPAGIELLLKAGAGADKTIREGNTALTGASFRWHDEVVALLLKFGVSVNQTMNDGTTALFCAAQQGEDKVVEMLARARRRC